MSKHEGIWLIARWYMFAALGGFGGVVWPHFSDQQTDAQQLGCIILMFVAWGVADVLRAIRKRGEA